jgi:acetylglutamate kinase
LKIVVKIGGAALEDRATLSRCAEAVTTLAREHQVAVVHGGGAALTRILEQMGKESEFVNGLRITDGDTRDVALMVLAGQVNKKLVAALSFAGQSAMGLCGGDGMTFRARKKKTDGLDLGFVGEICKTDTRWIEAIWSCGAVPVISSVALGVDGQYYNVNADQMASACAIACNANALIFLTDVSGVKDQTGTVIRWLQSAQIAQMVQQSVVSGGMLPKLQACEEALRRGVGRVRILPAINADLIANFYDQKIDSGTEVLTA